MTKAISNPKSRTENVVFLSRGEPTEISRRSLQLERILTPQLQLLSPRAGEVAELAKDRETALASYADRLRDGYRTNRNGFRDGLMMLAETIGNGQAIAISCGCRAGELCHADVVKMAVEKVSDRMQNRTVHDQPKVARKPESLVDQRNVRTERAIAEILSYTANDRGLSKIDDTKGRTRYEQADHLSRISQFLRDEYEHGAVSRNGIAILPRESATDPPTLALTTTSYAVERLGTLLDEPEKVKELAIRVIDYGNQIAGPEADRETKLKVFSLIYDSLEGKREFGTENLLNVSETKEERIERTLEKISQLADEMGKLESQEKFLPLTADKVTAEDLELEQVQSSTTYERLDVREHEISKLVNELSDSEKERWFENRFPGIDRELENGTPKDRILNPYRETVNQTAIHEPSQKGDAINDLKIANAYIEFQLQHPETRLRHFNPSFRRYAEKLERASTREEVLSAAAAIREENAKTRSLTPKELRILFTEPSPHHYSTDMTAARLDHSQPGPDRQRTTDALHDKEIKPGPEATRLIESLESRLERRTLKDSLSATKHFLESLRTPNDALRYKNPFDHQDVYRKLTPAEKDFVYQQAVMQKEKLESKMQIPAVHAPETAVPDQPQVVRDGLKASLGAAIRETRNSDERDVILRIELATVRYLMDKPEIAAKLRGEIEKQLKIDIPSRTTDGDRHPQEYVQTR